MDRSSPAILFCIILFSIPIFAQNFSHRSAALEAINSNADYDAHFAAFASKDRITLHWPNHSNQKNSGFKIYRSEGNADNFVLISSYESNPYLNSKYASVKDNQFYFADLVVAPGISYWYKLICVALDNNSSVEYGPVSASLPVQAFSEKKITVSPPRFRFESLRDNSHITKLQLDLPYNFESTQSASIAIYEPHGELVKTIYSGPMEAGSYQLVWKGDMETGDIVKEGVFIAVFENDFVREATKLILLK